MSYLPKVGREEDIENRVAKRIDEILSSVRGVSTLYVEPGDVVLVTIPDDMEEEVANHLRKLFAQVFNQNKGVFVTESIKVEVAKNAESGEEVRLLKSEIASLRKELEALKSQIDPLLLLKDSK